ncbi:unnamed protein product [Litomosoides sigmodontis]|uniref:Uncharacterized protein n=1 Tax=Litomosoides sigmodontis TaxID=42156 RepID=A0A3P6S7S7_LITSI|nr:unnamed protein product [Litomosoides sigmodontis]
MMQEKKMKESAGVYSRYHAAFVGPDKKPKKGRMIFRDIRWLSSPRQQFIALSTEQIAFYEDIGEVRPKLLGCLPLNRTNELFVVHLRFKRCIHVEQLAFLVVPQTFALNQFVFKVLYGLADAPELECMGNLQCFDLSPLSDEALALGYENSKVVITKVAAEPDVSIHHSIFAHKLGHLRNLDDTLELVCDLPKSVTSLSFSSVTDAYLAACLEGGRSQDYTVCVYDISAPKMHVFCANCNERVMDFTWLKNDPSMLCLGCSRSMKFFDIREGPRPICSVPVSNQVRSISAGDVHFCIACIIDDFACIYDRRYLKSPLHRMRVSYLKKNDSGAVKILWNPHSPTCLSCFRRNSRVVTELISPFGSILEGHNAAEILSFPTSDAIDLVQCGFRSSRHLEDVGSMKLSHPYLELNYKFFGISRVSGFTWHPEKCDRLLVVAPDGGRGAFEVRLATVNKFVTGDCSSQGFVAHASGNQLYVRSANPVVTESADISFVMKSRAARNFGSPPSATLEGLLQLSSKSSCPLSNGLKLISAYTRSCKEIIDCCPYSTYEVKWLWKWIRHMISILDWKPCIYKTLFPGVMDIMKHSLDPDKDELTTEEIFVVDPLLGRVRLYRGKERDRVLRMCGWPAFGDIVQLDAFIDENIVERRTQSRAVAAALITVNSSRMEKVSSFANDDIPLEDRIAFAAIHFSDQYFMESLKELFTDTYLCRTLFGLLIVGISYEKATHDLLSQYVDYTGDIQTATVLLVIGCCFAKKPSWLVTYSAEEVASIDLELQAIEDNEACDEIEEHIRRSYTIVCDYLDMLNTWGMWVQRARLDCILGWRRNAISVKSGMSHNTAQAEICCQFCPQNITLDKSDISAASTVIVPTTRSNISTTSSSTPSIPAREMACRHCLKPLPKCILCRRHMGSYVQTECHELGHLSSWFAWCQKCRHGGHMAHLWHWFNGHAECAASGCLCNCKMEETDIVGLNNDPPQPCLFCEDAC